MIKHWYQKNLRFLHTVLRETDIIGYDAAGVVNYMKEVNANTLVVSAGGVIDFFRHDLDMANLNQFYKQEILPDICKEIHKAGMRVIVRVDFRGPEPRRYNLHPDWFALDQNGKPRIGTDFKAAVIYRPCYNSPYTNTHAENFINYLLTNYELDGIWQNALNFDNAPCYCKRCRTLYKEETGKEIPHLPGGPNELSALETPLFAEYQIWKAKQADKYIEKMRATVKKHGEEKGYFAEVFDIYSDSFTVTTGIDHSNAMKSFDFIISCVFLNKNHADFKVWDIINNSATTIRFSRALDPKKQPVVLTGNNGTRWRYVKEPSLETRLWMWQIVSVGGGISNCYFNGQHPARTHDRRGAYAEKDMFTYLAQNAAIIQDTVPAMDVAIFYSNATKSRLLKLDETKDDYGIYIRGIERVLLENHIQYGFVTDLDFSLEKLKNVKALLLPNTAYISDKHIDVIREYVRGGGALIASRKTSLFDENGKPRNDFGLNDVLGISYTGLVVDTANDTYQLIRDKENPVLKDVGDTEMLMNGDFTVLVSLINKDYKIAATHIPTIHNQPPEYSWLADMKTDYPTIVTGTFGKGRAVYFANAIEALCFTNGHEDYTEVYKNALDYASGGNYLIKANAPRSVHINIIENQNDPHHLIIAMVNTTGTSQRPLKEVIPVPVEIRVPLRVRKLQASKVLWGDRVKVAAELDAVLINVNALDEFASVELRF